MGGGSEVDGKSMFLGFDPRHVHGGSVNATAKLNCNRNQHRCWETIHYLLYL